MKRYKFLYLRNNEIISKPDVKTIFKWKKGKWYKIDGELHICHNGFHCSVKPLDALNYVAGKVLAVVEVRGESEKQDDKQCWQEMRILKAYRWTKKDSIALAVYSAELVIGNFEKEYPDDDRPRKAIEAAKKVLENDTSENRDAARSAAESAELAAQSVESAAWSARSAAWVAADEAWVAAWLAAGTAITNKINKWMIDHIKELDEIN